MIDATRIIDKIYMGSRPPIGSAVARTGFKMLVLCAEEYQPPASAFPGVNVVHAPFDDWMPEVEGDAKIEQTISIAKSAARAVADASARGVRVLVTCNQGRNRSGLVVGFSLYERYGLGGANAIKIIRGARAGALVNPWFVFLLEGLRGREGSLSRARAGK